MTDLDVMDSAAGGYESLGRLLRYPDETFHERLATCRSRVEQVDPKASEEVEQFAEGVEGLSLEQLQELSTRTFDLNPVCSLEVGWQLFGEEYSRGTFLVAMRNLLRENGFKESVELPDHLTHILPLLDRLEDTERVEFNDTFLKPALTKMLAAFEGKKTAYVHVLRACDAMLLHSKAMTPAEVTHG